MTNTSLANSTGIVLADADWLDTHFQAMQPEYEEALRWVGIQRGWHVLDAGCGAGSYLPLLTELVGRDGRVSAMDVDPQNVALVEAAALRDEWPAPVTARVGALAALPYEDATFDAVWCANVTQYLTDNELAAALRELVRVTKKGGLVAIKDADLSAYQVQPGPPEAFAAQLAAARIANDTNVLACFRTCNLAAWLRRAGLHEVAQKHVPMVRTQPLRGVERKFFKDFLDYVHNYVTSLKASPSSIDMWGRLAGKTGASSVLDDPDFMFREVQIVFVGRV